jgi:hypothetical protein
MKVFISSVRSGLEVERDSLPGLIMAVGHSPLRFEDFTSQPTPSREACLRGVQAADVYLLLLGPHYGDPLPETGLSPTHEEYNAALARGVPRLAFRKTGVDLEPAQAAFAHEVEAYSTGLFRAAFSGPVDLQAKVVAALRDAPGSARTATWSPLPQPVTLEWPESWSEPSTPVPTRASIIDVHAVPTAGSAYSTRQLRETAQHLADRLRTLGLVPPSAALDARSDSSAAWACPAAAAKPASWEAVTTETLLGVRISASGQRSVWQQLPADHMGSLLDPDDLPGRIGSLLRLLGTVAPLSEELWAIGAGLTPATLLAIGSQSDLGRRNSVQMQSHHHGPVHVEPEEAVNAGALGAGAAEVGSVLARNLLDMFGRRR